MIGSRTDTVPGTRVRGTTPYPWPWDGDLTPSATTLLVVAEEGPATQATTRNTAALPGRITALAQALRTAGGRVVAVSTRRPLGRKTSPAAMPSAAPAWAALLDAEDVDDVVSASGLDPFLSTDLELILTTTGTRRLLLVGTQLEVSVHSALRSANDRGFECLLIADACSPGDERLTPASISMVEMSGGIFGAVGQTAAALDTLAGLAPARSTP